MSVLEGKNVLITKKGTTLNTFHFKLLEVQAAHKMVITRANNTIITVQKSRQTGCFCLGIKLQKARFILKKLIFLMSSERYPAAERQLSSLATLAKS